MPSPDAVSAVADASTAVVALAALIVAGWAAKATVQTNRAQQQTLTLQQQQLAHQQELEREAREQRRRSQAEMIGVWADHDFTDVDPASEYGEIFAAVRVHISNASPAPIYGVIVEERHGTGARNALARIGGVAPSTTESGAWSFRQRVLFTELDRMPLLYITFMDGQGNTWCRSSRGELLTSREYEEREDALFVAYEAQQHDEPYDRTVDREMFVADWMPEIKKP
ncbi:hypothetical protein Kisp01_33430 [Kineosporia sp. NBRC 101677]|nr:hypothetical protein Kisp01_33430 [Kineosporia sp. NBRC 101677]